MSNDHDSTVATAPGSEAKPAEQAPLHSPLKPLLWMVLLFAGLILFGLMTD